MSARLKFLGVCFLSAALAALMSPRPWARAVAAAGGGGGHGGGWGGGGGYSGGWGGGGMHAMSGGWGGGGMHAWPAAGAAWHARHIGRLGRR